MMRNTILLVLMLWGMGSFAQPVVHLPKLEDEYTTGVFKSEDAYTFDVMNDPAVSSYYSIFQYLQGKVPGLMVYDGGAFSKPYIIYRSGRPAFFLNEVPADAKMLASLDINDIALVKVFRPPFAGAIGGGPNGAIAVYTQKGDEDDTSDSN